MYVKAPICILIRLPNFSFLTQLLPEIWSPIFAIGLTLAPEMGFCFFPSRSRFFGVVWVSGYFLAKSDKIRVSEALQFFSAVNSLLTTLNFTALKLQL